MSTPALLSVGCSATKRPDAGLLPAIDRYDGPAFRVLRKARRAGRWPPDLAVWIVSAECGLIALCAPIPWYDRRMTAARARALAPTVAPQVQRLIAAPPAARRVHFHLSRAYWQVLVGHALWEGDGVTAPPTITMARGGIGQQLAQLRAWLDTLTEEP